MISRWGLVPSPLPSPTDEQLVAARAARRERDKNMNLGAVGLFVAGIALVLGIWVGWFWSIIVLVIFGLPFLGMALAQSRQPGRISKDQANAIRQVPLTADPVFRRQAVGFGAALALVVPLMFLPDGFVHIAPLLVLVVLLPVGVWVRKAR